MHTKRDSTNDQGIIIMESKGYTVAYDYRDVPTIRKFALSDARIRYLYGPWASGKTAGCIAEVIRKSCEQQYGRWGIRKSKWMVIAETLWQLKDCTIPAFMDWIPPRFFGDYTLSDRVYRITKFPETYIEILFRTLDDFSSIDKFPDFDITAAWFNGCADIPQKVFDMMDARIERYPSIRNGGCSWGGIIIDTAPPDKGTFLYKLATKKRVGVEVFSQPSGLSKEAENTSNLPSGYYKTIAAGKDKWYIDKYIHGKIGGQKS